MATNTVTTSVVVQFTKGDASGVLVAEVDDRDPAQGGLNGGKTSFLPGDPVVILRYKSNNVTIDAEQSSMGQLASGSSVVITKTEDVTFAGDTEASLRYPVSGAFSYVWIGQSAGSVTLVGENTVRIPAPAAGSYAVGVARCTYQATGQIFTLTHGDPGYSDYSIVVFFAGHTA